MSDDISVQIFCPINKPVKQNKILFLRAYWLDRL